MWRKELERWIDEEGLKSALETLGKMFFDICSEKAEYLRFKEYDNLKLKITDEARQQNNKTADLWENAAKQIETATIILQAAFPEP